MESLPLRLRGSSLAALAFPPLDPPNFPRATAAGIFTLTTVGNFRPFSVSVSREDSRSLLAVLWRSGINTFWHRWPRYGSPRQENDVGRCLCGANERSKRTYPVRQSLSVGLLGSQWAGITIGHRNPESHRRCRGEKLLDRRVDLKRSPHPPIFFRHFRHFTHRLIRCIWQH